MKKQKIVIFNPGCFEAESFYYCNNNKYEIVFCIDFNNKETYFHNIPVYNINKLEDISSTSTILIVIFGNYKKAKLVLENNNLIEFKNFIHENWLHKKMVILYGNCHFEVIRLFLENINSFTKLYYIYQIPLIHKNSERDIDENILKHCDIFIYQHISMKKYGKKLSTEYVINKLPESCLKLSVPNFYGVGMLLTPDMSEINTFRIASGLEDAPFVVKDNGIDKRLEEGMDEAQIIENAYKDNWFSKKDMYDNFELCIDKLKERETRWDVKIIDFIESNYRKIKLFYEYGHPTNALLREVTVRILNKLGIEDINGIEKDIGYDLSLNEVPIYPCVQKYFQLEFEDKVIRKSIMNLNRKEMNLTEYIKEYIYWKNYTDEIYNYYQEKNMRLINVWINSNKKIILFGTGMIFGNYMKGIGAIYPPYLIVDNNQDIWDKKVGGIEVKNPKVLSSLYNKYDLIIIICSLWSFKVIKEQLISLKIDEKDIFYYLDDERIKKEP